MVCVLTFGTGGQFAGIELDRYLTTGNICQGTKKQQHYCRLRHHMERQTCLKLQTQTLEYTNIVKNSQKLYSGSSKTRLTSIFADFKICIRSISYNASCQHPRGSPCSVYLESISYMLLALIMYYFTELDVVQKHQCNMENLYKLWLSSDMLAGSGPLPVTREVLDSLTAMILTCMILHLSRMGLVISRWAKGPTEYHNAHRPRVWNHY